jgi:uncharacterized protein (TIGR02145 family)
MKVGFLNNIPQRIPIKKICNIYYLRWYYNGWHYWAFFPGKLTMVTEGEKYRTIGTRKITMGSGQITSDQCAAIRTIMNTREVSLLTDAGWMNIRIEPGTLILYDNQIDGTEIEFTAIVGSRDPSITGYSPIIDIPIVPIIDFVPDCSVAIGTQVWMCYNYDSKYPGSKVYNNDESARAEYGGLYTYNQVKASGFCPAGWHVPTLADWNTLITFLGGATNAGGFLKEYGLTHWESPNNCLSLTNKFAARGSGYESAGTFNSLGQTCDLWLADEYSSTYGYFNRTFNFGLNNIISHWPKLDYLAVRLLKDIPSLPLIDLDGNIYTTIIVGTQEWIVENLRTTHYSDGTLIPEITDNADWIADVTGAMCWHNNDRATYENPYGAIYNGYAVAKKVAFVPILPYFKRGGIQESGWRIPTKNDFLALIAALGGAGAGLAPAKMKEVGTTHWLAGNDGTNISGLTLVGTGSRDAALGTFIDWQDVTSLYGWDVILDTLAMTVECVPFMTTVGAIPSAYGNPVRCVRDI